MKERPIRFSDAEVRAILEGRKTQTRRVVKTSHKSNSDYPTFDVRNGKPVALQYDHNGLKAEWDLQCPHGTVGDRLWVREAWTRDVDNFACPCIVYRADSMCLSILATENGEGDPCGVQGVTSRTSWKDNLKWRPSIHMPRWASRITLEITGVRVERVRYITEEDAKAEGLGETIVLPGDRGSFVQSFAMTWNQINGPESWSANPWVWVIEFRRVATCGK